MGRLHSGLALVWGLGVRKAFALGPVGWRQLTWRLAIAVVVVAADLLSKSWAVRALARGRTQMVWRPWLTFVLLRNPGATLGLGAGHPWVVTGVATITTLAVVTAVAWLRIGGLWLSLLLGGAVGNLWDRLAFGVVTDFVHLRPRPGVFNLADVAVRVGALGFVVAQWRATSDRGCTTPRGPQRDGGVA